MAGLRYGIVTFKGQRAGILKEEPGGGTSFIYDNGWSESIACAFPVDQKEHSVLHGLHPFFAHLAPEGWLRDRQSAYAHLESQDDFGILLAFGADCVGAVGVEDPEGAAVNFHVEPEVDSLSVAVVHGHRTISGVQAKLLCVEQGGEIVPAPAIGPAPLIAKYPSEVLTDLVANEYATLRLCEVLLGKDEIVRTRKAIVKDVVGVALVVERFDRAGSDYLSKLRCEDFAQIVGIDPGRDFQGKYRAGYDAISQALSYSSSPVVDARRAFLRLAAFVILGNVDCHLKNWSLFEYEDGLRLSPIYDVVNGYIYGALGYTTRFGLQIDGEQLQWDRYDRDLLLEIATTFGLSGRAAEGALKEQAKNEGDFFACLGESLGLSEDRSYDYRANVQVGWEKIHG